MIAQSRRRSTLVFSSVALTLVLYGCEVMAPPRPLPPLSQPSPPPSETLSQAPVTPPPPPAGPPAQPASPAPAPASPAPPPAPVPVLPFDEAMLVAANNLFTNAKLRADAAQPSPLLIDPLIDGSSGEQSSATQTLGARIVDLVRAKYPRFDVRPFSAAGIAKAPIVLIGTFTGVNHEGKTAGVREAYRICLALADLKSGLIVAKGTARAQLQGVDVTPTAYFRDSPTWRMEPSTEGYIKTCQGTKIGDPINPAYLDGILSAALIGEAIEAYDAGRYRDALELYENAVRSGASDVLRAQNGIYLANWKLGRRQAAMETFGQIVDNGLASQRLTVKFLFRPGSTAFVPTASISEPYPLWLKEIAWRSAKTSACLEITGHTSPTGPEPLNERLSLLRAETIKQRLETEAPPLARRSIANGVGSRENLIGTGRDDVTDALDRRVVFKVIGC